MTYYDYEKRIVDHTKNADGSETPERILEYTSTGHLKHGDGIPRTSSGHFAGGDGIRRNNLGIIIKGRIR